MKDTLFCSKFSLSSAGKIHEFDGPIVMGILNATPDSFYASSRINSVDDALAQADQMIADGAQILDIGGYSSRPGANDISAQEEINRIVPVIKAIRDKHSDILISIDTFRAEVAAKAVEAGASIINDISGGQRDKEIIQVAASNQLPYIIMHMRGTPQTMQSMTEYEDVVKEVIAFLQEQLSECKSAGISDLIVDPGFGFSKTIDHNYEILSSLEQFQALNAPLLVGVSRKSMMYKLFDIEPEETLAATTALNMHALLKGAAIIRVHDVKEGRQAIELARRLI